MSEHDGPETIITRRFAGRRYGAFVVCGAGWDWERVRFSQDGHHLSARLDLKQRQAQIAIDIANARRLITESDIERTELHRRLQLVPTMLQKARLLYDTGDEKARQVLNTAMFEYFEVDSRDAGPTANGWTPQDPVVDHAELTEIVDAVLEYHPDATVDSHPIGHPIASSKTPHLTSANDHFVVRNVGVPKDTNSQTPGGDLGGLGRFRRAVHRTGPERRRDGAMTARRTRHERTLAGLSSVGGSNNCYTAVAEGFEPPDGVSRLSLSRRVH